VLQLRQRADAAGVVAQQREVADVGQRDQPDVVGHVAPDGPEQVDVDGGGQPGQREVPQPPQAQPLGDHRVQPAQGGVLDRAAVGSGAEGEPGRPLVPVRAADGDGHPLQLLGQPPQQREDLLRGALRVGVGRLAGDDVEVEHDGAVGRDVG
jgi:hypothetical protein